MKIDKSRDSKLGFREKDRKEFSWGYRRKRREIKFNRGCRKFIEEGWINNW